MNLKKEYLNYFKELDHKVIPSSSVIPENDPTCLFITAGMQPLIPYLKGEIHPLGKRLVGVQKCFRTNDLDSVGDICHHTFFEMLGNWSLGDYFKEESIEWSFKFLTKILKIPVERLGVSVFRGNDLVEKDLVSASKWEELGITKIAYLDEENNWWPNINLTGPSGPDSEIFYYVGPHIPTEFNPDDKNWVEIWNNVFMQYNHLENGEFILLQNKNVDTGMGVERTTTILEGLNDNYLSSIFIDSIKKIEYLSKLDYQDQKYQKSMRIIADHIRAVVILLGDEALIKPSNTDQGYILRRLIRRSIRHARKLKIDISSNWDTEIADIFINQYGEQYPELLKNRGIILDTLREEKVKFIKTLEKGLKELNQVIENLKTSIMPPDVTFKLYDTYGFPIELTKEIALEHDIVVDIDRFNENFKEHQEKSRLGSKEKFIGGLASRGDMEIKYHTATHLLNAALKEVLGSHVHQKGSNITSERMRFDFSHDQKLTVEEIKRVEDKVNEYINLELDVIKKEMTKEEALKSGAEAMFISKYGDIVSVYEIGNVSKEICGGPHVNNTRELGRFKIKKEESSSASVRRIKAILE